jgi:hypothetical protein
MAELKSPVSLASLSLRAAAESAYEFEFETPDGSGTGIFFPVLGAHSDKVTRETNVLLNEHRKREAVAAAKAAKSRPDQIQVTPIEDDIAFGQRLAAIRLVVWRGIEEPCTPENALLLCQTNPEAAAQITARSGDLANFIKNSKKT